MISLYSVNFLWPLTQKQEFYTIEYGDYQISDVLEFIKDSLQVSQQVQIYGDIECQNLLESQYKLSQYAIHPNGGVLYVCEVPQQQQNNLLWMKVKIDDENDIECLIPSQFTVLQVISQCKEQGIIVNQINSIEFMDENGLLLGIFYSLQLLNFYYNYNFQLKIHTQQPVIDIPEIIESQIDIPNIEDNQIQNTINIHYGSMNIEASYESTINDIIIELKSQGILQEDILSVELLDENGVLLSQDQSIQFLNFQNHNHLELRLNKPQVINIQILIDSYQEYELELQTINYSINEIIDFLQEQGMLQQDIASVELLGENGILFSQDQQLSLSTYPNISKFLLILYTQQPN